MGRSFEIPLPLGRQRPLEPRAKVPKPSELRKWAIDKGLDVGDRGRISPEIEIAYMQEQLGLDV